MAEELRPCPYCGAKATGAHQAGSAFFIDVGHEPTCFLADFQRTEAEAIAAWNALHLTETDRTGNATQEAELTRLRQRVAELEGALEPFAGIPIYDHCPDEKPVLDWQGEDPLRTLFRWTCGDFRRATSALTHKPNGDGAS